MVEKKEYEEIKDIINESGYEYDNMAKLKSSYYDFHKSEPNYTNVYKNKDIEFMDCIDYIFVGKEINVMSCLVGLLNKDPMRYQYPNAICPSDHIPLSSSLSIE
jgi:mRNA deadenylase 3'-5' endonuclease subunit Ccr4